MIRQPQASLGRRVLAGATRWRCVLMYRPQATPCWVRASASSRAGQDEGDIDDDLSHLEEEYSKLKVNWFPGHMVKATRIIREKLKQVDMVLEVRDARIPFSSANEDLDRIVGSHKARLIVLNKADLANQALEQRVVQRFKEQGKTAVYACSRTGENFKKILAWAKNQGPKRGEFHTTGAVAMVVGMPNVGKSSLINLLLERGKRHRRRGKAEEVRGQDAEKVARVGAMPGVTRQVSAFRISTTPPLYLVDTPGIMVPRVETATQGLRLALTGAVPESSLLPSETLVGFMVRVVRLRMTLGTAPAAASSITSSSESSNMNGRGKSKKRLVETPRSHAVEAWLSRAGMESQYPLVSGDGGGFQDHICGNNNGDDAGMVSRHPWVTNDEAVVADESTVHDDRGCNTSGEKWETLEGSEGFDGLEALLNAVERESGAAGKADAESRRQICCRFLLEAFREGQFGRITLDSVLRRRLKDVRCRKDREFSKVSSNAAEERNKQQQQHQKEAEISSGSERGGGRERVAVQRKPEMSEVLIRDDWSSASAWDRAQTRRE